LKPLEPPFDPEVSAALAPLGPPIALFRVHARRPEMVRAIAGWGGYYLSAKSALHPRLREIVIDRTTALCGADYEWGVHIAVFADKVALTREQLRSLGAGRPSDACWVEPTERAALRAVDELHSTYDIADETWAELVAAIGADGALELVLVCGWYHAISFAVKALRLPLEPRTRPIGMS
jgi:alkylhydroperoxidase family enzyme